jgi:hypothetical protein
MTFTQVNKQQTTYVNLFALYLATITRKNGKQQLSLPCMDSSNATMLS